MENACDNFGHNVKFPFLTIIYNILVEFTRTLNFGHNVKSPFFTIIYNILVEFTGALNSIDGHCTVVGLCTLLVVVGLCKE